MAVRLRLMRMGKKKQPTYRVVAADSRSPRNGRFIEIIGTYQPRLEPSVVKIDNERAVHWLQNGAQPSETVEKLLKISGAWADYKGEQFVPPVPPTPKTKSSVKKSEPSAPVSESNDSDEAKSEDLEVEETSQDDEVAVVEDDESTDDSSTVVGTFTCTISDAANGKITMQMTNSTTAAIEEGMYVYDLEITASSGTVTRIMEGKVTVNPEVTR